MVAYVAVRKADSGRDGQKLFAAYVVDLLRLERGADNAVKSCVLRGLGVVHDNFVYRLFYQKIALHRLLIGGGQLRYGDEQGTRAVRAGHALLDRVRDIVKLEVEEYLVSARLYLADYLRTLGIEKLHADLDERLSALEFVEKVQRGFLVCKVAGDYHIFTHCVLLL